MRILFHGILFLIMTRPICGQTVWTAQTGDWFEAANWSNGLPNSSTDAQINNGGTPQIATSGATANNLYLGFGALDSGNILISGAGSLQNANQLAVGYS